MYYRYRKKSRDVCVGGAPVYNRVQGEVEKSNQELGVQASGYDILT